MSTTSIWHRSIDGARRTFVVLAALLALGATSCAGDTVAGSGGAEAPTAAVAPAGSGTGATALAPLPVRAGPRTETTHAVPHAQTFVDPVPEVDAELRRRIYSLPGVENRETIVSLRGTTALWLNEDANPTPLAATMRDREFGHIHPDGSLHTVLPVDRAIEATTAKWAELHPWVGREDFWNGLVMLYTPQDFEELEITWQLIVESYNFVTGQDLTAADFIGG